MDAVVEVFASDHVAWVAVLDRSRRVVGVVGTADLVAAYRRSLVSSLSSLRSIFVGSVFVETAVDEQAAVAGASIADARWPVGVVVVAIQRGSQLIFPEPGTTIQIGDVLSMLVPAGSEARTREILGEAMGDVGRADDSPMI